METDENCYYCIDNCQQEIEIREKKVYLTRTIDHEHFLGWFANGIENSVGPYQK